MSETQYMLSAWNVSKLTWQWSVDLVDDMHLGPALARKVRFVDASMLPCFTRRGALRQARRAARKHARAERERVGFIPKPTVRTFYNP